MRLKLFTSLCALVLVLGACGGGDDGGDDEQEIRDLVATFYENEEGVCDVITQELLEREFESKEQCEEQAAQAEPQEGVEVEAVRVDGDTGEADVNIEDQLGTLEVAREDGEWKVADIRERDTGTGTTPDEGTGTTPDEGAGTTPDETETVPAE